MRSSFFNPFFAAIVLVSFIVLAFLAPLPAASAQTSGPQTTATATPDISGLLQGLIPSADDYPTRIIVPSIKLNAPIEYVGVNEKGEMDVPDGKTGNVGWYKYGTVPGKTGTAVMDAHVFAAFAKLRYAKVGSDIYILTAAGKKLHFVVGDSRVYRLNEITPQILFGRDGVRRLNLITCAGKPTRDGSTYTHRLVVFATLVDSSA